MKVASTARRIFDPQGKKTFATISANSDLTHCSKRRPIRAHREGPLGRWRPVRSERGKQTSRIGRECEHRLILLLTLRPIISRRGSKYPFTFRKPQGF